MALTFAVIDHPESYYDAYDVLLAHIRQHFSDVQSGVQGDAWIWIFEDGEKVAVDSFYAMQMEIHADADSPLVQKVIDLVGEIYPVRRYEEPIER